MPKLVCQDFLANKSWQLFPDSAEWWFTQAARDETGAQPTTRGEVLAGWGRAGGRRGRRGGRPDLRGPDRRGRPRGPRAGPRPAGGDDLLGRGRPLVPLPGAPPGQGHRLVGAHLPGPDRAGPRARDRRTGARG